MCFVACWEREPHKRPTCQHLLSELEELRVTCKHFEDDSFHSMQEEWREEIQQLFLEIKSLENELRDKELNLQKQAAEQEKKGCSTSVFHHILIMLFCKLF